MKSRTFAAFVGPSVVMMLVFIAFPLVSVFVQSFYITQTVVETVEVETCTPGFLKQTCVTEQKTQPVLGEDGKPLTKTSFVGLASYANVIEPARAWAAIPGDRVRCRSRGIRCDRVTAAVQARRPPPRGSCNTRAIGAHGQARFGRCTVRAPRLSVGGGINDGT